MMGHPPHQVIPPGTTTTQQLPRPTRTIPPPPALTSRRTVQNPPGQGPTPVQRTTSPPTRSRQRATSLRPLQVHQPPRTRPRRQRARLLRLPTMMSWPALPPRTRHRRAEMELELKPEPELEPGQPRHVRRLRTRHRRAELEPEPEPELEPGQPQPRESQPAQPHPPRPKQKQPATAPPRPTTPIRTRRASPSGLRKRTSAVAPTNATRQPQRNRSSHGSCRSWSRCSSR